MEIYTKFFEGQKPAMYIKNTAPRITIFVSIDLKTLVSYLFIIYYSTLNHLVLKLLAKKY